MIGVYDLSEVRLMEFFQVMKNVKKVLEEQDLTNLGLNDAKIVFDDKLLALEQKIKPSTKSQYTQSIKALNKERDYLLMGFVGYCRAVTFFPDQIKSQSARTLMQVIEKYGKKLQVKPMQEKTAIIYNLIKDFEESSFQEALSTIDAKKWSQELEKCNQQFEQLYHIRTQEKGKVVVGATQQARKELNEAFRHIVKSINALSYLNGIQKYEALANYLNEEIKRIKAK